MSKSLLTIARILNKRQARKHKQEHGALARWRRLLLGLAALLCVVFFAGAIVLAFVYASITSDLPAHEMLPLLLDPTDGLLLEPTRFTDRSGKVLLAVLQPQGVKRRFLPIDPAEDEAISPYLVTAVVTALQPDYWQSPGYEINTTDDPSPHTIAERLVSDLLLWQEEPNPRKAWRASILARQITLEYGRARVLEWFLNSADFGHGAFGAEAAARLYLGKPASALTLGESAFLTALLRTPALNPLDASTKPLDLMQPVLEDLIVSGVIQAEQANVSLAQEIELNTDPSQVDYPLPAVVRIILRQLEAVFGSQRLARGGLIVVTTIDAELQTQTACAVQAQLARMQLKPFTPDLPGGASCTAQQYLPVYIGLREPLPSDLSASALVLDPFSSEVLALTGDSTLRSVEGSLQDHDPGSLLAPFVAVAGFARGLSPASLVWDVPSRLPESISPRLMDDDEYKGPVRLRAAVQGDALNPVAQLLEQSGAQNVSNLARAFGLNGLVESDNPLDVLYAGGAQSPLQLALAYAVFDNGGIQTGWRAKGSDALTPITVKAVLDANNSLVWEGMQPTSQVVVSAPIAYLAHSMLSESSGQAQVYDARAVDIGVPAAFKAGTLADSSSAWMLGYTRQRLALVWMGSPTAAGGLDVDMPAGIWRALMKSAQAGIESQDWSMPDGVTSRRVCDPSGLLPTTLCPSVVEEVFLAGEEPYTLDDLYQSIEINRETGLLATVFTPLHLIDTRTVIDFPPDVRDWASSAGWEVAPLRYDLVKRQSVDENLRFLSPEMFAVLGGEVPIYGTVILEDMQSYRLEAGAGINPAQWELIAEGEGENLTRALLGIWDTGGKDGLYCLRLMAQGDDLKVRYAIIQVSLDNTPPTLSTIEPFDDEPYKAGSEVLFSVHVEDNLGVSRVEWWLDQTKVGARAQPPYAMLWTAQKGEHALFARVYDHAGNLTQSDTLIVRVVQ